MYIAEMKLHLAVLEAIRGLLGHAVSLTHPVVMGIDADSPEGASRQVRCHGSCQEGLMTSHLKAHTYLSGRFIGKLARLVHFYPAWMEARLDEAGEIKERLLEVRRRALDGRLLIVADARAVLREFYSREVELSPPGIGWTFPCREDGSLLVAENEAFLKVALSTPGAIDQGISRHQFTDHLPAVGECACRTRLVVSTTYNMCPGCGRTYDLQGLEIIETDDRF